MIAPENRPERTISSLPSWRVSEEVLSQTVDGEAVVLELESGRYFGLDEIGSRVWSMLSGGRPLEEITDSLVAEYDATRERVESDLARFLAQLSDLGLVRAVPAGAGPSRAIQ